MTFVLLLMTAFCLGWIFQKFALEFLGRFSRYQREVRLKSLMDSRKAALPFQAVLSFFEGNKEKLFAAQYFHKYFSLLSSLLKRADLPHLKPEHLAGYQVLGALGASLFFGVLAGSPMLAFLAFAAGGTLPLIWLRDKALRREGALLRELPNALEILSLCTEAGLSVEQGLDQYLKNVRPGPIREELEKVLEQARTGSSRKDAFTSMSDRLGLTDFSLFTTSLVHAEKFGTGVSKTLRQLSLTLRDKQFQRAEKVVQEMPVKLLIPLVVFIMPVTFLIIFGPIVLQFFQ